MFMLPKEALPIVKNSLKELKDKRILVILGYSGVAMEEYKKLFGIQIRQVNGQK